MFRKDPAGVTAGRTFHLGNSWVSLGGFLAREDVRKVKHILAQVERYIDTAGYLDTGCIDTGADVLSQIAQGAGVVSKMADSPLGQVVASYVPYGNIVAAAAKGAPTAIALLQGKGGLGEHATTVAQLASPDPAVRKTAVGRVANINAATAKGDKRAAAVRAGLQKAMMQHKENELRELRAMVALFRERLAMWGDPVAWQDQHVDTSGPPQLGPGLVVPTSLKDAATRALARSRVSPQPSFRNFRIAA